MPACYSGRVTADRCAVPWSAELCLFPCVERPVRVNACVLACVLGNWFGLWLSCPLSGNNPPGGFLRLGRLDADKLLAADFSVCAIADWLLLRLQPMMHSLIVQSCLRLPMSTSTIGAQWQKLRHSPLFFSAVSAMQVLIGQIRKRSLPRPHVPQ